MIYLIVSVILAAEKHGGIMISSTVSTTSLEEVAQAAPNAIRWFQLYVYQDREATRRLVKRAEAAGFKALVLTVDSPQVGRRRDNARNAFTLPSYLKYLPSDLFHSLLKLVISKNRGLSL